MIVHIYRVVPLMVSCLLLAAVAMVGGCVLPGRPAVLVEYWRTGGFAGVDDHLTVYENGQAILTYKGGQKDFVLQRDQVQRLIQLLDEAKFGSLKKEYIPGNTCCDLFEYRISYKGHTIRTMDTAVPNVLQPILDSLNEIVRTQARSQ